MVTSEVSKDPPSPFLTVQSACDGILLPAVPPATEQRPSTGSSGSKSWQCSQSSCSSTGDGGSFSSNAAQRGHLQSIVSQQSLNFGLPPDSPFEFEQALHHIAAVSAAVDGQPSKLKNAAAAAGFGDLAVQSSPQQVNDTPAPADVHKCSVLRFLPLGGSWLRTTQSLPQCSLPHKRQHAAAHEELPQQELSFKHIRSALDKQEAGQDGSLQQQQQLQPVLSRRLKARMHKLLAWASGKGQSVSASSSPQVHSALPGIGPYGSLTFTPGAGNQQQQQAVPVPWQHQVFTEQQQSVHLITALPGTPPPLRSPRTSLVSIPSSCDCPMLLGRYSSTGSEGGYARSPAAAAASSVGCSSISCSQSCSLTTTPSPGKAMGLSPAAAGAIANGVSMNGSIGTTPAGAEGSTKLKMTASLRLAHHRHRQHKPTCRYYQQQQVQPQPGLPAIPQQPTTPTNSSSGGLAPQSSLRTALQQLETMASLRASRIMDKLNAGLQKVTSHRVFDGVLRSGTVGKEVMRDWELGPTLGMGASCVTRLVTEKTSGRTAACKSISKQGILHSEVVKAAMLAVQREVAILQAVVGHPHVVALHAVYEDVHSLHMIMDWCGGGSLWQLMERCPGYMLPEAAAAAATKAVLDVLAHCHARGVMHRDIKPDNLLIAKPLDGPHQLTADLIKVSDFGISVPFTPGLVLTELAGTMGYIAPEVLQRCYTEQADVWSTGVMLYEMVCGQLPYRLGNTCEECLAAIDGAELDLSSPAWQAAAPEARELVTVMLARDPACRPSAQQLLDKYGSWLAIGDPQKEAEPLEQ